MIVTVLPEVEIATLLRENLARFREHCPTALGQVLDFQRRANEISPHFFGRWQASLDWRLGFSQRIRAESEDGCWTWLGTLNGYDYGFYRKDGRSRMAHRVAYEWLWAAPIPKGLDLDHLCRVRFCVNPGHLEPVSRRVNLLRGKTLTARNAAATHCPHGHAYDTGNTHLDRSGNRHCRTCNRISARARYVPRGRTKTSQPC